MKASDKSCRGVQVYEMGAGYAAKPLTEQAPEYLPHAFQTAASEPGTVQPALDLRNKIEEKNRTAEAVRLIEKRIRQDG